MKAPWWPRTFRDWLAFQLLRLAAVVAESDQLCDARRRLAMNRKWLQPTMGGAAKSPPARDST